MHCAAVMPKLEPSNSPALGLLVRYSQTRNLFDSTHPARKARSVVNPSKMTVPKRTATPASNIGLSKLRHICRNEDALLFGWRHGVDVQHALVHQTVRA